MLRVAGQLVNGAVSTLSRTALLRAQRQLLKSRFLLFDQRRRNSVVGQRAIALLPAADAAAAHHLTPAGLIVQPPILASTHGAYLPCAVT